MNARTLSFALLASVVAFADPAFAADNNYEKLVFSPDGSQLAAYSYPGKVSVWNVNNGKRTKLLDIATSRIVDIEFNPDAPLLATLYHDLQKAGGIILFDTRKGRSEIVRPIKNFDYRHLNSSLSFSADGKRLATLIAGQKKRGLLTVAKNPDFDEFSRPLQTRFPFEDGGIEYLKGSTAAIYRTDAPQLSIVNVNSGDSIQDFDLGCDPANIFVSVKRNLIVADCSSTDKVRAFSSNSYQFLWDYSDVYSFALAVSADGSEIFDVDFQSVKVRSAFTGVELRSFPITGQSWYWAAASSKDVLAVSELSQGLPTSYVIGLYDTKTGQRLRTLD